MTETHQKPETPEEQELNEEASPSFAEETEAETQEAQTEQATEEKALSPEAQIAEMKDQLLRALAEAENTRRRAAKDREEARKFAISSFARDLLSVSDNLRRALEAVPEDISGSSDHFKNLLTGVEATERALLKTLENHGVKKIEPLDEVFDPNFHEVMFEAPMPDKPAGTIIQVMEPGYVLNERLLRPARVGVAKEGDAGTPQHVDEEV